MTKEKAYSALVKITGLYNKTLSDEKTTLWLNELEPLFEIPVQKVVNNLKSNYLYLNNMPTLPQFLALYNRHTHKSSDKKNPNTYYCYVCNNKGYDILRKFEKVNDKTYIYDYALHCDCCKKGEEEKVKSSSVYSEPIGKYFNVDELAAKNRARKEKYARRGSKIETQNNKKTFYNLLSKIYS
ncbi:MAG: hypothetical protein ABF289_03690 [Clostridiales bacterium]